MSIEVKKPSATGGSQGTAQDRTLWSGLANFQVVGVNTNTENPNYNTVKDGVDQVRIDFHLKNANNGIQTKVSFWISDESWISKSGKTQVSNDQGKSCWLETKGKGFDNIYGWFDTSGIRANKKGEEGLTNFIRNWTNAGSTDSCRIDDMDALFKGDFSQLQNVVESAIENEVTLLLGVTEKEGKNYQTVYTKHIARSWHSDSTEKFIKSLKDDYGQFKAEPFTTVTDESVIKQLLNLKEYNPNRDNSTGITANDSFEDESSDLPF